MPQSTTTRRLTFPLFGRAPVMVIPVLVSCWLAVGAWAATARSERGEFAVRIPWGSGGTADQSAGVGQLERLRHGMTQLAVRGALGDPVRTGLDPSQPGREYWEYLIGTTPDVGDSLVLQFDFGQLSGWDVWQDDH